MYIYTYISGACDSDDLPTLFILEIVQTTLGRRVDKRRRDAFDYVARKSEKYMRRIGKLDPKRADFKLITTDSPKWWTRSVRLSIRLYFSLLCAHDRIDYAWNINYPSVFMTRHICFESTWLKNRSLI